MALLTSQDSTFAQLLSRPRLMVVAFVGNWCPHCRALMPVLQQLANNTNQLDVVIVDYHQNPQASHRHIQGVPAVALTQGGGGPQSWLNGRTLAALQQEIDGLVMGTPGS